MQAKKPENSITVGGRSVPLGLPGDGMAAEAAAQMCALFSAVRRACVSRVVLEFAQVCCPHRHAHSSCSFAWTCRGSRVCSMPAGLPASSISAQCTWHGQCAAVCVSCTCVAGCLLGDFICRLTVGLLQVHSPEANRHRGRRSWRHALPGKSTGILCHGAERGGGRWPVHVIQQQQQQQQQQQLV